MRKLFFICLALSLFACEVNDGKKGKKPVNLLSEDKMVQILIDVHILEAYTNNIVHNQDSAAAMYKVKSGLILQKAGVTKKDYDASMKYYTTDIVALDKIYDRVVDSIKVREIKLEVK